MGRSLNIDELKVLGQQSSEEPISSVRLAQSFGWQNVPPNPKHIIALGTELDVCRGYTGIQPAALFATSATGVRDKAVDLAALYGYHASVRWGIYADQRGLTPFNSHWLISDRWFRLPTIEWGQLDESEPLLEAFQPRSIVDGAADRLALERFPSPTLLQPVDDELVERLDWWRGQALKNSSAETGVDEQLQTLFAKLFVLRTIEDRNLADQVPSLKCSIHGSDVLNHEALIDIFEKAREYVGSELFDAINLELLPEHVIAGVIRDLYIPRRLGSEGTYNFSWIDSDVLGLAYEKYLSTILHPGAPSNQMDLFGGTSRDVDRISVRKAGGVYYTPQYLTKYLASKCISDFYETNPVTEFPKIVDFACGSGSFLVAALDVLIRRWKQVDADRDWGRELIEGGCLSGIDVDEKAVTVARLNLWNRLAEEPNPLPLPNLSKAVLKGDGLDQDTWGELPRSFDIALGNPPFLATSRVENRSELEARFKSAKGRYDFSYLFVEQAIAVTAPNGVLGMVVPNRLFRNQNGGSIRELLTSAMDLLTVVDFGSNEVFDGTSAYIGCLVARHKRLLAAPATEVRVVEVKKLPEQYIAAFLIDAEGGDAVDGIRVFEASHPRGAEPWALLSSKEKLAQVQLSELSTSLSEVAGVFQGIRTGANDIFILRVLSEDDRAGVQITNGLGDTAVLELGLLEPVVFGSELKRYQQVQPNKYLLYPYEDGVPLSEPEIERKYPQTFRYLSIYREILAARSSLVASGLRWYELVRRRDTEWLRKPKLLIRDLAPETAFAVDPQGGTFVVGGSAVVPQAEEHLYPLLAYLNSRPVSILLRRVTPQFRGGFQKFEPQHLQHIPILLRLIDDPQFCDELAALALVASDANQTVADREAAISAIDLAVQDAMSAAGIELAN